MVKCWWRDPTSGRARHEDRRSALKVVAGPAGFLEAIVSRMRYPGEKARLTGEQLTLIVALVLGLALFCVMLLPR